eukprot:scaffold108916_cov26-Tisochrysis_lutea.AAC.1
MESCSSQRQASGNQDGGLGSSSGGACQKTSCLCRSSTYMRAGRKTRLPTVTWAARMISIVPSRYVTRRSWSRSLLSESKPIRNTGSPEIDTRTPLRNCILKSLPPKAEHCPSTSAQRMPIRILCRYNPGRPGSERSNSSKSCDCGSL